VTNGSREGWWLPLDYTQQINQRRVAVVGTDGNGGALMRRQSTHYTIRNSTTGMDSSNRNQTTSLPLSQLRQRAKVPATHGNAAAL